MGRDLEEPQEEASADLFKETAAIGELTGMLRYCWLGFFDGAASSADHGGEFPAFWPAPGKDRRRMRVWIGRGAAQSREWDSQILPHGAQENGAAIQKDNASRQGDAVSGISGSSSLVHGGLSSQHCGSFIATRGRCSINAGGHYYLPPSHASVQVFKIDGPRFIKLNEGTWHASPLFGDRDSMVFYNLELSDTNVRSFEELLLCLGTLTSS
ncbi:uncharacterized protein LOC9651760 [Selaginella moellendorffii]|uniref:uncharacterized protein LOC9651760 n=1 Tax=Selaginella moellendorffii TaxID=88036 RepID=UPI000D1D0676|nr:uncharacterized protein LOC9651760 [Selaginella moellendorffii]|eukprot:XP_024533652.1 uncharacterized protein LOC9651760 [Selaginella moellendorffii]